MRDEIEALINSVKSKKNPTMVSDDISDFVITSLREKKISLYEAYLINMEAVRFKRLGYTQPAWSEKVRISICLNLLNQKLLADVFNESVSAIKVKELAIEAYRLNKEKRLHFIMNKYNEFLDANVNVKLLQEMLNIRRNYDELSDDDGPYHNEVFPYHFYSPEEILLNEEEKRKYLNSKRLDEDVEELIVQLNIFEL